MTSKWRRTAVGVVVVLGLAAGCTKTRTIYVPVGTNVPAPEEKLVAHRGCDQIPEAPAAVDLASHWTYDSVHSCWAH